MKGSKRPVNELQNSSSASSKEVSQSPAKGPNAKDRTNVECGDRCPCVYCFACILSTNQRLHDYLSLKIVRRHETFRPERHEERPHRRLGAGAGIVGAAGALVRRAEQRLPARRARGPRQQPAVDAADVEAVVALGQHPHALPGLQLGQADGAHGPSAACCLQRQQPRRVDQRRHRAQRLPPRPSLRKPRHRLPRPRPRARLALRPAGRRPAGAPERAPHDGVEPQRADERAQQHGQDHDHVRVEAAAAAAPDTVARRSFLPGHHLARRRILPVAVQRSQQQRPPRVHVPFLHACFNCVFTRQLVILSSDADSFFPNHNPR
jgi:hypothetical protein|uniref:Uncharacterized protein n=1 Tax=Zea mays TaxID=4577 RepID=A0A804U8A9_MAIZE